MNIKIVLLFLMTCVTLFFVFKKRQEPEITYEKKIAFFTPTSHPALEEIEQAFQVTLQSLSNTCYKIEIFNANGNKTLLRAQAEEIVVGNYDLIATIGANCSQTIAELLHKKQQITPHVFTAVDGLNFAQKLVEINSSSTGLYITNDYKTEIALIHRLKPAAKTILLVYDPTHGIGLEHHKKEIEGYCADFDITLDSIEIYQSNEISQKVAGRLSSVDVVLVLTDNTVVAGIDALITLCNRYGVLLVASDLASGKKGAGVAYGVTEYESGKCAAEVADMILRLHKKPSDIALRAVSDFCIAINQNTIKKQGLDITEQEYNALIGNK